MHPIFKKLISTVMTFLVLAGCGYFGRKEIPYHRPVPHRVEPVLAETKDGRQSTKPEGGVRTAALKPKGNLNVPPPEPQDVKAGQKTSPLDKPSLPPPVSEPNALASPSEALSSAKTYPDHRKRIMVVGDSLSVGIGAAMTSLFKENGQVLVLEEGKVSSGLNSPDFYDWETKLTQLVGQRHPDAVVIIIGGNDAYNGPGTSGWAKRYRKKVQKFLDIAAGKGIQVYWAGLPVMRKPGFSEKVKTANEVIESVCNESDQCHYIDTWDLVDGKNHEYVHAMNLNGRDRVIRAKDGTHFTYTGYKLLGRHIIDHMADL